MKSDNKVHHMGIGYLSSVFCLCFGAPWLSACESEVIVDDGAPPDEEGECTSCQQELPPYEGTGECAATDEVRRSNYERWTRSPNLFGNLPPGSWEGTIAGSPASLTIEEDFSASLVMGTPTVLDGDIGPYCQGDAVPYECGVLFSEGGVYPIHGAELSAGELSFSLKSTMIYDEWCKLQSPTTEGWQSACEFGPEANLSIHQDSPGVCTIGESGEPIDCARLQLVSYAPVCGCASDGCFVHSQYEDEAVLISLQTSDDGLTFEGEGPNGEPMQFARVD